MTWGEGAVLFSDLAGEGRNFRCAGASMGGPRFWAWSGQARNMGLAASTISNFLKRGAVLPASGF